MPKAMRVLLCYSGDQYPPARQPRRAIPIQMRYRLASQPFNELDRVMSTCLVLCAFEFLPSGVVRGEKTPLRKSERAQLGPSLRHAYLTEERRDRTGQLDNYGSVRYNAVYWSFVQGYEQSPITRQDSVCFFQRRT